MAKLLISLSLVMTGAAYAESVYKCHDQNGGVTYSATPCYGGSEGGAIDITDNVLDHSGARRQTDIREEREELARQAQAQQEALRHSRNAAYLEQAGEGNSEVKDKLLKELESVKKSSPRALGDEQRKHKKEIEIMRNLTDLEMAERGASPDQIKSVQQDRRISDLEERASKQKAATTQLLLEQQRQKALSGRW